MSCEYLRTPMLLRLYRRWKRARLLRAGFPPEWTPVVSALPFVGALDLQQRRRLEELIVVLVHQVHWEGRAGLVVNDEMRVTIAAQACRLTLCLGDEAYSGVRTIYVFPATYRAPAGSRTQDGVESAEASERLGEAWLRGPVVVSWDAAQRGAANPDDGRNVIYHEFAHKLDMLDGYADGTPPARSRADFEAWKTVSEREYGFLVEAARRGTRTLLDPYGATNPAEFFAVATELFFERPAQLKSSRGELYACLRRFYGQDPSP